MLFRLLKLVFCITYKEWPDSGGIDMPKDLCDHRFQTYKYSKNINFFKLTSAVMVEITMSYVSVKKLKKVKILTRIVQHFTVFYR